MDLSHAARPAISIEGTASLAKLSRRIRGVIAGRGERRTGRVLPFPHAPARRSRKPPSTLEDPMAKIARPLQRSCPEGAEG